MAWRGAGGESADGVADRRDAAAVASYATVVIIAHIFARTICFLLRAVSLRVCARLSVYRGAAVRASPCAAPRSLPCATLIFPRSFGAVSKICLCLFSDASCREQMVSWTIQAFSSCAHWFWRMNVYLS